MSGWIRGVLFQNMTLKVVSLVLAVVIYVLVRPAGTPGNHRVVGNRDRPTEPVRAPRALDAARKPTVIDAAPGKPVEAAAPIDLEAVPDFRRASGDAVGPNAPRSVDAAPLSPTSGPTSRPGQRCRALTR